MLTLTLVPAQVWKAPVNDAEYRSFDANLMFASGGSSNVDISPKSVVIRAQPNSQPSINLATTLRKKITASLDATILENRRANQALRVGVWSPWTSSGFFLIFGPSPQNTVNAITLTQGAPGPTLTGGEIQDSVALGKYQLGSKYHLIFVVDRTRSRISVAVAGEGINAQALLPTQPHAAILDTVQISITASASPGAGSSEILLQNYLLTLPHERSATVQIHDATATTLLLILVTLGLLFLAVAAVTRLRQWRRHKLTIPSLGLSAWIVIGAIVLYIAGNASLIPLGGHPFDFRNEEFYAYVARTYGPVQLYYLPNIVSLASIWNGVPYVEAAFPYEPVFAYLFTGIGWVNSVLFADGGLFNLPSAQLGYLVKSTNVAFCLADGFLIYSIARELRVSKRWSLMAACFFVFNPAVWFSMSVWGQTHVISLFFVLATVLMIEKHQPTLAWLALVAAALTRPQMTVFALLLGIILLRKFSWTQNLVAVAWSVIVFVVILTPLTIATSPSLPIDIMLNNFLIQEAGGNQGALTTVSQGAYSIWPLVTYLTQGASGLQRSFSPSSGLLLGTLTYQSVSQILTGTALIAVIVVLLRLKHNVIDSGAYVLPVTLGITAFLMLLTGLVATHFLLALPFLLLCRRWMGTVAYLYVAVIWSVGTLVPMYGDMGVVMSARDYPVLAAPDNAVTKLFVDLHAWDRFISAAVVANICAVLWLAFLSVQPLAGHPRTDSGTAISR
jgi:hypothetical protein